LISKWACAEERRGEDGREDEDGDEAWDDEQDS
jgi:hypothetical protein